MAAAEADQGHKPVMLAEVLTALAPADGEVYVDGTFGGGGYSRAILQASNCTLYGIDRDPTAATRAKPFADAFPGRFSLVEGCFGDLAELMAEIGVSALDGLVLDIGVSSFQLDEAERGFSFQADGPLDMRMSRAGESAADVVNSYSERDLADLLYRYGDETKSRRIAARLVAQREEAPFSRTLELASAIVDVIGMPRPRPGKKTTHPATKSFQALRIHVNDELGELERVLIAAERLLSPGGRLVVVSFHSLEDRIVKQFLAERAGRAPSGSRHRPSLEAGPAPTFHLPRKSAVKPSAEEERTNPRSRSARLRAAIRTEAAAWEQAA